jgi:hypothetical protein
MQSGELLLVDAACNYGYMAADITRTYPVSGTFSPLHKDIYRIVLQAQEAGDGGGPARRLSAGRAQQDGRGDQGGPAEAGPHHRYNGRPVQDVVSARRDAFPRHRRPRCRRPQGAARGRHGVHDRTWHLHPPERARRPA